MLRQFLQCLAVAAAIGLVFATTENANARHNSGGSYGSHGSFGGVFGGSHGSHGGFGRVFGGSHGGSFGGFFSRHHGSHGSYGSHGGYGSHRDYDNACECGNMEADDAGHVDVDDGSAMKEDVKENDMNSPADETK